MNQDPDTPSARPSETPSDESAPAPVGSQDARVYAGTGVSWAIVFGVLVVVVVAILAAVNTTPTELDLVFWQGEVPLISIILVVAALAVVVDELVGLIVRRNRRRRLHEKHQLRQLKKEDT